jgi:alpha-galactosidase
MLAAPLMAGNDVRNMSPEIRAIMTDKEVIAIDQDAAGKQAYRALSERSTNTEVWVKGLSNGEWAVIAHNTGDEPADIPIEWNRLWTVRGKYSVRDVWAKQARGDNSQTLTMRIDAHDVALFRLTPIM